MLSVLNKDHSRIKSGPKWRASSFAVFGLALLTCLLTGSKTEAQELDGAAIKDLAFQGTWAAPDSGFGFWSWSEDNTVCLRLFDSTGDCTDTGTWAIDGDTICYELEWWGEGEGQRALCLSVIELGEGKYAAQYRGEATTSSLFKFDVLNERMIQR